ncbi:TRAP transporter small permease [Nocardioides mesophilus]|uniref:TRAP transporter small permease n=1 Tax=Nocardioides mesophilus TaxID=433659 RepID=A0A7G9RD78_9ACTN|nr:TRAP transporter small permease [Nocardioides mesophilus]QNN53553.1 TRAP transporter small permease [Nocardioides mesophilus]
MTTLKYILTFRWANLTSEASGYLSGIALLGATFATMHGVASRYFLGHPTIWQTELSVYLLLFVTFVGGAYGLKHHAHVGVDLMVEALPARPQLLMRVVASVLSLVVVLVVLWTATTMWWEATESGWTSSTVWAAPLSIVYAILPLGMLLIACQYIAFVIEGVLGLLGKLPEDEIALLKQQNPELSATEVFEDEPTAHHAEPAHRAGVGPDSRERSI